MEYSSESGLLWCDSAIFYQDSDIRMCKAHLKHLDSGSQRKVINMIKPIMKDILFLGQKSEPATKQDLSVGQDLQDTLQANRDRCVGMAAYKSLT